MHSSIDLAIRRAECLKEELSLMDILGVALLKARNENDAVCGRHGAINALFRKEQSQLDSIPFRPKCQIARLHFYDGGLGEATGLVDWAITALRFSYAISNNIVLPGGDQICIVNVDLVEPWKCLMMPEEIAYVESLGERYRQVTAA